METKTKWRTFWLSVLVLFAAATLSPSLVSHDQLPSWFSSTFNKKIQLGLDLQGGLHIVYSVDLDKAVDDKASEIKRDLEDKLAERSIEATVSTPVTPVGSVNIVAASAEAAGKIDDAFMADYDESLVIRECEAEANKKCFIVSPDYAARVKKSALEQAIKTIRDRINEKGVAEPTVVQKGDDIIVELPGLDQNEIERVKGIIKRTAKLEFKIVDDGSEYMKKLGNHVGNDPKAKELGITFQPDSWPHRESGKTFRDVMLEASNRTEFLTPAEAKEFGCWRRDKPLTDGKVECEISGRSVLEKYLDELQAAQPEFALDDNHEFGFEEEKPRSPTAEEQDTKWRTYYLLRAVELSGSGVSSALVTFNPTTNRPEVVVNFNRFGGQRFGELTGDNVGKKMAIMLDGKINSAPVIQTKIDGGASTISMGAGDVAAAQLESEDLVNVLRTGSLPAPLKEESSSIVGPLLGSDAVAKAKVAFGLGALLVLVIMVGYYRKSGGISMVALVINILFMMAILALFGATLTLPGIAALVLTVGMAVDANIIIYERIREELRTGKSVRGAVDAGFSRGFAAIIDGQLTTAVAGYVLYSYGSGPIQGFATMLLIGIVCTLFTATWCTRLFFDHYVGRRKGVTLAI